jgi:hypothetical protein
MTIVLLSCQLAISQPSFLGAWAAIVLSKEYMSNLELPQNAFQPNSSRSRQSDLVGSMYSLGRFSSGRGFVIIKVASPRFDDMLCLLQGFESLSIQTFIVQPTIV